MPPVDHQRLAQRRLGVQRVAVLGVGQPEVGVHRRVRPARHAQLFLEQRDRASVVAALRAGERELAARGDVRRIGPQRAGERARRPGQIALGSTQQPEVEVAHPVLRIERDRLLVVRARAGTFAEPLQERAQVHSRRRPGRVEIAGALERERRLRAAPLVGERDPAGVLDARQPGIHRPRIGARRPRRLEACRRGVDELMVHVQLPLDDQERRMVGGCGHRRLEHETGFGSRAALDQHARERSGGERPARPRVPGEPQEPLGLDEPATLPLLTTERERRLGLVRRERVGTRKTVARGFQVARAQQRRASLQLGAPGWLPGRRILSTIPRAHNSMKTYHLPSLPVNRNEWRARPL